MSDAVIIQMILGIVSIIISFIGAVVTIQLRKLTNDNTEKIVSNTEKIASNTVEVASVKKTVEIAATDSKRSKEEIHQLRSGAYNAGVLEGEKRSSGYQRLYAKDTDLGTLD